MRSARLAGGAASKAGACRTGGLLILGRPLCLAAAAPPSTDAATLRVADGTMVSAARTCSGEGQRAAVRGLPQTR